MTIPIAALKAQYEEISELFITEINATPMILSFVPKGGLTTSNLTEVPNVMDEYGGRVDLNQMPDRGNEGGTNLEEIPTTATILTRAYWAPKMDKRDIQAKDPNSICKIITYASHSDILRQASFATINGRGVTMLFSPVPYGLFEAKQYCCSYWQVF